MSATALGSGALTAEQVRKAAESNSRRYELPFGDGVWITEYDWHAIADELNAEIGSGTCQDLGGTGANDEQVFNCSECGCVLSLYDRDGCNNLCTSFIFDYPRYCPECGRKVVDI